MWVYLGCSTDLTSSLESEDSALPWQTGSGQLPIVKSIDTHKGSCSQECQTDQSQRPLFGIMLRALALSICRKLTLSPEDSHARISVAREMASAWAASEVDFIGSSIALSKKHAPHGFSSKTSRPLELEDYSPLFDHLPISGMTVGGLVYLPQKLVPRTLGKGGFCWPTATAKESGRTAKQWIEGGNRDTKRGGMDLSVSVKTWLTTPTSKDRGSRSERFKKGRLPTPEELAGGKLNPAWVEWLMGYPQGWTELKDWAMQWFRCKPKRRLKD